MKRSNQWLVRYAISFAAVGGSLALRQAFSPLFGTGLPYVAFSPAVMLAAILGGVGPGLLATILAALAVAYAIIPPVGQFLPLTTADLVGLILFVGTGCLMSAVAGLYHRATHRLLDYEKAAAARESLEALQASEARFRTLFENLPVQAVVIDPRTLKFVLFNHAAAELMGYTREEYARLSAPEVEVLHDRSLIEANVQRIAHGEAMIFESKHRTKSGEVRDMLLHCCRIEIGGRNLTLAMSVDITERKQAEAALRAATLSAERAKQAAEDASRAKDHFLAVLSHELRTPLTPVLTTASLMEEDSELPRRFREDVAMMRRNVELEARLIDDLLDVTRISRGKVELDRRPIPLWDVVHRAVEVCRADIEARQLKFAYEPGSCGAYIVLADAARLQQVFWNLLKNAVKFTPHGGRLGMRCRQEKDWVIVEVFDNGEGIDPAVLPHIFNPFEQGGPRVTRQFGGLGLGLTISKGLVEMHGGSISAYSEGKGKGASFRVRLPIHSLAQSHPATKQPPVSTDGAEKPEGKPLRILLVEDHGDTARIMRRLLMAEGHQVEIAGDVATALELAGSDDRFDLLLSDLGLPDGNGVDLIRELRQRGNTMPAIALSGYGQEEDVQRTREAGFVAHLTKPTSPDRLADAIMAAVAVAPQA